jgi:hypothetical protein
VHGSIYRHTVVNGEREFDGKGDGANGVPAQDGDSMRSGVVAEGKSQMCVNVRCII